MIPGASCVSTGLDTLLAMQELVQQSVQALGTVVTIVGLMIVAPYEAGRVPPAVWHSITRALSRVRGWLFRLLRLGRNIQVNVGSVTGITSFGTASVYGRTGVTDKGTTKQQLAEIRAAVASIHAELDGLRAEDKAIRAELTVKLDHLAEDHAALRQAHEEQRQEAGQLNARGFPLAAVGALLAGLPGSWLAAWWVAVPLVGVGVVAAGVALRWLWEARDKLAEGWHAFRPGAQRAQGQGRSISPQQ
jgi:hypothetical protein